MPTSPLPTPTLQQIEEFAAFYARDFGVMLTPEEAREAATRTLRLIALVYYGLPAQSSPSSAPSKPPPTTS